MALLSSPWMLRFTLIAALFASPLAVQAADGALRADLERIAHTPIYFGHQSVGANILEGVRQLADGAGVPLHIAHGFLAENGEPLRKLASFNSALGEGSHVDIALMKFCYVDVNSDTDASALFERYRATIAELRAKNPRTTFVHVTLATLRAAKGGKGRGGGWRKKRSIRAQRARHSRQSAAQMRLPQRSGARSPRSTTGSPAAKCRPTGRFSSCWRSFPGAASFAARRAARSGRRAWRRGGRSRRAA